MASKTHIVAGPELDAEIARVVFGYDVKMVTPAEEREFPGELQNVERRDWGGGNLLWSALRSYSTDIAAAWTVIEALKALDFDDYTFFMVLRPIGVDWPEALFYLTPEQICRAALLALAAADGK